MTGKSIFSGWEQLVSDAFQLSEREDLNQKSTCQTLSKAKLNENAISSLAEGIYRNIGHNVGVKKSNRQPSEKNWCVRRETEIAYHNPNPETVLEKSIVALGERGDLPQWYNQCPVASGMIDAYSDRRSAVDLLRIDNQHADLIELKRVDKTDTPAYAAIEILRYGLAYLFSRDRKEEFGYKDKFLLNVQSVDLKVLAPSSYYKSCDLGFLTPLITDALKKMCDQRDDDLRMSFSFWSFPEGLPLLSSGAEVHAIKDGTMCPDRCNELIHAVNNLIPVWH